MKIIAILFVFGLGSVCGGQEKSQDNKKNNIPASENVRFQLVKTDGTDVFLVQDVRDPTQKPVEKQYTVAVPVTRKVIKDGKPVTITDYITETRVRMMVPTVRKTFPVQPIHVFRNYDGKKIDKLNLIGKLGMGGKGKLVVQIFPNQRLSPQIKKLLSKDTIFLHHEVQKKEDKKK